MVVYLGLSVRIVVGSIKYPIESSQLPPVMISASDAALAFLIYSEMESKAALSITAFIKLEKSSGLPILISFTWAKYFSFSSGQIVVGM